METFNCCTDKCELQLTQKTSQETFVVKKIWDIDFCHSQVIHKLIGKMIAHFNHSPQAYGKLKVLQEENNVPKHKQNISTRWNSTFLMYIFIYI